MKIYPEQLTKQLTNGLAQTYLLFGNEPLLKQEAIQQILTRSQQNGFVETQRFHVDAQLKWDDIVNLCQAQSLFSSRQNIIITLPESGINISQTNGLKDIAAYLHADIVLILEGPRLTKQQESAKWFLGFTKNRGVHVPCNTPEAKNLPRFIQQRCQQLSLQPDQASVQMLAQYHEGNLLALVQTLQKLTLLFPDGHLTLIRLQEVLDQHNHFTPFQLTDALIEMKPKRALRIARQLEAEGIEITLPLRLIQKELVQLSKMKLALSSGVPIQRIFSQFKVWQHRQHCISQLLHRLSYIQLVNLLKQLAQIELMAKTDMSSAPWASLHLLCLNFCGMNIRLAGNK